MTRTTRAPRNLRREISTLRVGGEELALHTWRPREQPKGAVFYFHGLQSHAGWLWEAGPRFADNDIAFHVLDRRGSGISGGPREHIPEVGTVVADYTAALTHVRELTGEDVPLTLFGHCLGGSFLAGLLHHSDFTVPYEAVVYCSAWLGRLHHLHPEQERARIAAETGTDLYDPGLDTADFTADPRYRRFIDGDDLATRRLTRRSRATLLGLEELYMAPDRPALPPTPTAFLSGLTDPIVDLDAAHGVFQQTAAGRGMIVKYPTDRHYLFFTPVLRDVVDWTSAYTVQAGRADDV